MLKFVVRLASRKDNYTDNITDMVIVEGGNGAILVATSNKGGGLTSYRLGRANEAAQSVSKEAAKDYGTYYTAPTLDVLARPDGGHLVTVTGQHGSIHSALLMTADGSLKKFVPLFPPSQIPANIVILDVCEIAGESYIVAGTDGSTTLRLYRLNADLSLTSKGAAKPDIRINIDAEYTDIEVVTISGKTFVYAASAQGNFVATFEIGTSGIVSHGVVDAASDIGVSAPHQLEVVKSSSGCFVVVAGGESDSVSVFKADASGRLTLVDHVVDSNATRFEGATAIASAEIGGRAFIFVGGADDGISVLTIDGQGRLILLGVLEDTEAMTLANVAAIETRVVGGKISVFVTSATENGITQLSFDPGNIGTSVVREGKITGTGRDDVLVGTGGVSHLAGGAGDDILIARSGTVTLRGGGGDDIFLPGYGTKMVTILDFDPVRDELDLSELAYIRSIAQLRVQATSTGALLQAGQVRIEIRTANDKPLFETDFSESMFRLAHYANDIDYSDLVDPVRSDPGGPSAVTPASGTSGGYTGPGPIPPMLRAKHFDRGSNGPDKLTLAPSGGQINGLSGDDRMQGAAKARNNLIGAEGNDTLLGGNLSDYLAGGAGRDSLIGGGGPDRLYGGDGADFIAGGGGDDRIYGGSGRNILIGHGGNDLIVAEGNGGNILRGDAGSDYLKGIGSADTIIGGPGHDRLYGGQNNNRMAGNDGNDLLVAQGRSNVMVGGDGNDTIHGGTGGDYLYGDAGDDIMAGRGGDDFLIGHAGNDTIGGDDGDDHVIGMAGDDVISGGNGNDLLWGVDGNDHILGHSGKDSIRGGDGRDTLRGGDGNDKLIGGEGADVIHGGAGDDRVLAQEGHDTVFGAAGNDRVYGASGRDLLQGGGGNDVIEGGLDDDIMHGNAGDDTIEGFRGNDTLSGGAGNDVLEGGFGADVFVFTRPKDGVFERDTIIDFETGQDMIDLSGIDPKLIWLGAADFTGTGAAEIRMEVHKAKTRLLLDVDGDGRSDMMIDVYGSTVSPFDFTQ
ncbi:calcium-binding protein [Paracoccus albus]|uniref:calcium-binding protein n=1 Tax=Paracoccus albus TaxID=3017784 RepID=UPI0022F063E6|nr:calcium-binding protein [Paracoccus albus]WBU59782.1 calcium-binding protein [Paracoccus albus]